MSLSQGSVLLEPRPFHKDLNWSFSSTQCLSSIIEFRERYMNKEGNTKRSSRRRDTDDWDGQKEKPHLQHWWSCKGWSNEWGENVFDSLNTSRLRLWEIHQVLYPLFTDKSHMDVGPRTLRFCKSDLWHCDDRNLSSRSPSSIGRIMKTTSWYHGRGYYGMTMNGLRWGK